VPSRHTIQHYYIFGARSIYKNGWKAATTTRPPSLTNGIDLNSSNQSDPNALVWELYNLNDDFNERINLADKYPEKLKELKTLFDTQAKKYNLYPLIDWSDVFRKIYKSGKPPVIPH